MVSRRIFEWQGGKLNKKTDYQTLGEICTRLNCGPDRVKILIKDEGFPAVKVGGQYMTTEDAIVKWMDVTIQKKLAVND